MSHFEKNSHITIKSYCGQSQLRPNSAFNRERDHNESRAILNNSINTKNISRPVLLDSQGLQKYSTINKKYVSAKVEKEQIYVENLSLRFQIKQLKEEVSCYRSRFKNQDIKNKNKATDDIYKATAQYNGDDDSFFQKVTQSHLLDKLRDKYTQVKAQLQQKDKEIADLKATMKITKFKEIESQNNIYLSEIERLCRIIKNESPVLLERSNGINKNTDTGTGILDMRTIRLEIGDKKAPTNEMQEIHKIVLGNSRPTITVTGSNGFGRSIAFDSNELAISKFELGFKSKNYNRTSNIERTLNDDEDNFGSIEGINRILELSLDYREREVLNSHNQLVGNEPTHNKIIESLTKENQALRVRLGVGADGRVGASTMQNIDKHQSLKEIQKSFLNNEKFKQSVVFLMRASLLAKNINFSKFIQLFKLDQKNEYTEAEYSHLFHKQFYNLALITDIYDYFAIDILIRDLLQNFNNKDKLMSKLKKIFFKNLSDSFDTFIKSQIKLAFELKEIFLKKNLDFNKYFHENKSGLIKYKSLKYYMKSYSSVIKKEQIFALVFLMKFYHTRESNDLGFYDLNCQIVYDINSKKPIEGIYSNVRALIFPSELDINSVLKRMFNPELDIVPTEIYYVMKKYENYSSDYIRKKISFYLKVNGVELNKKQRLILERIIDNGIFLETVNNRIVNESAGTIRFAYQGSQGNKDYKKSINNTPKSKLRASELKVGLTDNHSVSENYNILEGDNDLCVSEMFDSYIISPKAVNTQNQTHSLQANNGNKQTHPEKVNTNYDQSSPIKHEDKEDMYDGHDFEEEDVIEEEL